MVHTHMPKPVHEEGDVTVLWNQAVHTEKDVTENRSDIIIKNKKEKACKLIDVTIPADRNVVQNEHSENTQCSHLSLPAGSYFAVSQIHWIATKIKMHYTHGIFNG